MKRRFTLLAIASFLSITVMAVDKPEKDGNGVYLISSANDLIWIASNSGDWDESFKQTADIDLNEPWTTPIGNSTTKFTGSYDGDGYTISNLNYNDNTKSNVGLFGYISGATLTKITVASGSIYGAGAVGGICGYAADNSTISLCANNATIYGKMEQNGGICGYLENSTITDCINYGLVSGSNFTGGVLGRCKENNGKTPPTTYNNNVINCVNVGQVFSFCATSGNIIGFNDNLSATITNCYYDNQINVLTGVTSEKTAINGDADQSGHFEGKSTSAIVGNGLQSALGTSNWYFENDMYPRLKNNQNKSAIILAATPVYLTSGDKADNVTKNFTVSTANSISWTSENESYLKITGTSASILKSTGVVVTATKDGYTKKVYLKTNKSGATSIGSTTSPITIESEEELKLLRKAVNNYGTYKGCAAYDGFKGVHFKVSIDIELSDWTEPIGIHNSFKGVFDGNHRTIKNINVAQTTTSNVGGLFGCASFGEIKNLTIEGSVKGAQSTGGLCGLTFSETITNCIVNCTVTTGNKNQCGGIVGVDKGYSTITSCNNYGSVRGFRYIGGIIGRCNHNAQLSYCKNYGDITSESNKTADDNGGICGNIANNNCEFSNCENYGAISLNLKNGGGIVGSLDTGFEGCSITNCINSGVITGPAIGGIIGQNSGTITIDKCLNIGSVTGGNGIGNGTTVSNCFNAGKANNAIAPSGVSKCINIGDVTTIPAGCTYDNQLFSSSGAGTGKLTSEMLGTELQSSLGSDWTYTEGMYPMITALKESDYMKVAATALILKSDNKCNDVKNNFNVGTNYSAEWTCSDAELVSFSEDKGFITNPGIDTDVEVYVDINGIKKTIPLTIKHRDGLTTPTISWGRATEDDIVYGTPVSAEMIATNIEDSYKNDGTIEWNVSENQLLNAGLHILTATFVPFEENENTLASVTIQKSINVTKADAESCITWEPESSITYGDEDSDSKLKNATATVDGKFSYTIPALTVGPHTMRLEFVGTNYETKSPIEKTINVTAATPSIAWANPTPIEYGTPLSSLQLGAVSGVGGTFTYTANGESIDIGTTLNVGTYTLIATLPAAGNYSAASLERTLVVNKATPTITWNNTTVTINYGETVSEDRLKASVENKYNDKGSISYSVNGQPIDIRSQLEAGTYEISATFTPDDNANYSAATTSSTATLTVKPITPTITWNNTTVTINYGETVSEDRLKASVEDNYKNKGSISYSVDGQPFDIRSQLAVGTYTVIATFTPNDTHNYVPVTTPVSATITVNKSATPPTITWNPATPIVYGTALSNAQLNANANAPGTITYAENGNTVTVGTVLSAGDHIITATLPASDNYDAATAQVTITVSKATPEISWTQPASITYGTALNAEKHLNASSEAPGTITYSENGNNVKIGDILNVGEHTITATLPESDNYNQATKVVTIMVNHADANLSWTPAVTEITYGDALPNEFLNASTTTGGTISYKEGGNIVTSETILNAGEHTITAILPASGNYNESTALAIINVNKATPVISWTPEDYTYGDSEDMINTKIKNASASSNGANVLGEFAYVLPNRPRSEQQTVKLTFTPTDDANFNSVNESRNIYFNKKTPVVTWDNLDGITYGTALTKQQQLNADISNNTNIVGKVKYTLANGDDAMNAILDAGTHEITATLAESAYYEKWEMTQTITVSQVEPIIEWTPNAVAWGASEEEIESNVKNAVAKDAKGNVLEGEFAYTIPELTAAGEVEVSVTFENKNYKTAAATTKTLNVTKAYPVIAWTPQNITFGASSDEIVSKIDNAQASYNGEEVKGAFEYDTNIPNLNAGTHVVTVKFTPQDGEKFNDVEETAELTIEKATPTIVWEPKNVTYGASSEEIAAALENAEAQFNGETVSGDYEYILPLTTDLQVGLEEMDLIAVVTFTPTGDDTTNFEAVSTIVNVVVEKATPVITWNTPEDITVGTALSAAQLNATANVDGNFAYTPAADAVLEVGEHQKLSVVFTPTDAENYNSASDSVFINVKAAASDTTQIDTTAAIVWAPSAIVYGTPVGKTFNATAKVEGEITYSLSADSILNAGEYKVKATLSPVNGNDTTIERIVKVAKAELTATAANDTIMQGDTMPTFEINYTGFVGNDNAASLTTAPTATCSASTDSVGSFDIVVSGGEAINYDFIHVNGLLTILAKGDTLQPIDTVQPIDTTSVAIITWAPAVSTITYGTLIDSTILNATANVQGTFTYSAIKVEFTEGDTTSIVYALGDSVINDTNIVEPNTTYTTRSLAIGDTLNAGTYKLIATFVPADSTISAVNDTVALTVNKAVLKVSVADVTIKQFDEIPASFEITYEGFVLGQNENNLTWIPKAKEQVSNADETGTFDIILLGGQSDNYEFDYHHGKLTILKQDDDVAINESAAIFEVYPNPSNGTFFVNAGDEAQDVRIFNSTGKLVKVETIDGVTRIDISEYANGMYFVKVGNQTKTIIKQ